MAWSLQVIAHDSQLVQAGWTPLRFATRRRTAELFPSETDGPLCDGIIKALIEGGAAAEGH